LERRKTATRSREHMAIMMFVPIFVGTAIALFVAIIGAFIVPGPDKVLHRHMLVTAVVMCGLMWLLAYMSQMFYLAVPEMKNHTSS